MLKSEGLVGLIDLQANKHQQGPSLIPALNGGAGNASAKSLLTLPSVAQRGMMKALTLVAPACEDQASREQYWARTLKPLVDGFASVLQRPDFRRVHNDDQVRGYVECVLESFIGVVQGTHVSTASALFSYLQPVLTSLVELLGLYHNYASVVELILELFCESARRILCYLPQAESKALYQRSVELIQVSF